MAFLTACKQMLPYLAVCGAAFYGLPLLGEDTGYFIVLLLIILPLLCLAAGMLYGFISGFHPALPLLITLLYLPTVYLYYNTTALAYALAFLFITFVGNGVGWLIRQSRH
ncbi:MAG: hypothetical protein O0X93_07915 [Methanocorpusculum sp.]|uniref:Uncharacterized protein n=1 Tax=Methanocorpusculum petauri TaxID=3002863 RepID=A0ABT4ID52_9EURY|nr:hypothetical protein [Methanocorpusculum petauri]MCZ9312158.1 hypothetical protein [Methanocorpusculum sp.]MCZ0859675.1 hypothetical protein [Methanocorpusculum petauri]MDE2442795.1 hypothetical protein [Methanocorpusculum sp.]MDE2523064.1 hypothetical protein [Methanocorpusculum sp.]MDE2523909.1 hypothetical protein [Methanocorpusculum sp.]